jgi:ABC-type multidrug transport system fused ATPase/permease subunit
VDSHFRKFYPTIGGYLVTAADDMTLNLKRKWFEALVRQDMAYFDLQEMAGTSTIISTNGAKYKKGVAKKLGAGVQFSFTVLVRPVWDPLGEGTCIHQSPHLLCNPSPLIVAHTVFLVILVPLQGGFVLAFYSSWRVSLAVLACVPAMALATGGILKINQTKSARDNAAYAEAGA